MLVGMDERTEQPCVSCGPHVSPALRGAPLAPQQAARVARRPAWVRSRCQVGWGAAGDEVTPLSLEWPPHAPRAAAGGGGEYVCASAGFEQQAACGLSSPPSNRQTQWLSVHTHCATHFCIRCCCFNTSPDGSCSSTFIICPTLRPTEAAAHLAF